MNAVILACSCLNDCVAAAQEKMGTSYPVIEVDRKYHVDPKQMKQKLMETIETIAPEVDTILVAMGFCGGSWEELPVQKRVVIPRVDDCITLLLHTDDHWYPDLKKAGHLYLRDTDVGDFSAFSPKFMKQDMCEKYGEENGEFIFETMFVNYTNVDIMDTGLYDCHSEEFLKEIRENAELLRSEVGYVKGSNLLLEKLVSGRWDQQFIVVEPGRLLKNDDFIKMEGEIAYGNDKVSAAQPSSGSYYGG